MDIFIYQIFVPLFCLVMLLNSWMRLKAGEVTRKGFVFWAVIWVALGVFALFPDLARSIAQVTGIKDSFRALVVTAFIALFYLIFRIIMRLDKMDRIMTQVVREASLEAKKKTSKK